MSNYSVNSKVGELLKDPEATAILEQYLPGIATNPQTKMALGMSFRALAGFPQSGLKKTQVNEIDEKLKALG